MTSKPTTKIPKTVQKLFDAIKDDAGNAFGWEAYTPYHTIKSYTPGKLEVIIQATSSCEHDGDVDGIYSQVKDLEGKSVNIGKKTMTITKTQVLDTRRGTPEDYDGDFRFYIRGQVTFEIK